MTTAASVEGGLLERANPPPASFRATRARYDVGLNWCHFEVELGDAVATFRLHLNRDPACLRVLGVLGSVLGDELQPLATSSCTLRWGSQSRSGEHLCSRFAEMSGGEKDRDGRPMPAPAPPEWTWLEGLLSEPTCSWAPVADGGLCAYHGVRLHKKD
jgi:hypothetical protein